MGFTYRYMLNFCLMQHQTWWWTFHQWSRERGRGHQRGSGKTKGCNRTVHLTTGWYVRTHSTHTHFCCWTLLVCGVSNPQVILSTS